MIRKDKNIFTNGSHTKSWHLEEIIQTAGHWRYSGYKTLVMVAAVVGLKDALLTPKGLELYNLISNKNRLKHLMCKYILT
jgi:hypothetical protein